MIDINSLATGKRKAGKDLQSPVGPKKPVSGRASPQTTYWSLYRNDRRQNPLFKSGRPRNQKTKSPRFGASLCSLAVSIHAFVLFTLPEKSYPYLAELRNLIYSMALESLADDFPQAYREFEGRLVVEGPDAAVAPIHDFETSYRQTEEPIPFLGFTQTCTLIRAEFRPQWLATHRVPLFAVQGYLQAFYPELPIPAPCGLQERMKAYVNPNATLRISIGPQNLAGLNLAPLLKHALRYPDMTIEVMKPARLKIPHHDVRHVAKHLPRMLDYRDPLWVCYLQEDIIFRVGLAPFNPWGFGYTFEMLVDHKPTPASYIEKLRPWYNTWRMLPLEGTVFHKISWCEAEQQAPRRSSDGNQPAAIQDASRARWSPSLHFILYD